MSEIPQSGNKWAIVTGASSGIGREFASQLAGLNKNIALVGRSRQALEELDAELREKFSIQTELISVDLKSRESPNLIDTLTAALPVDTLVASAGFGSSGSFLDSVLSSELSMVDVNCRSVVELAYLFGRRFRDHGGGDIVLLSSIVAFQGMPFSSNYAATKAFVQTFGEALATELKPAGVNVLCVAPGPTKSGFAERAGMKFGAALSPNQVVTPALSALGRRTTILPGFLSKLLGGPIAMLPRFLRIKIMGLIGKGMVDGDAASSAG